jgi:heme exporter protein A
LLYGDLSAEDNLKFFAQLYGLDDVEQRVSDLLSQVNLAARRRDPVRIFSRGMQQRLAFVRTIVHHPKILLLDEPHTGLDPESAESINTLLRRLASEGCSILFTSHDLTKAAELADRIEVLAGGRLAAATSGKPKDVDLAQLYTEAIQQTRGDGRAS